MSKPRDGGRSREQSIVAGFVEVKSMAEVILKVYAILKKGATY